MRTEYPACREADSATDNRRVEAPWSEPASRSGSEPKKASLHKVRTANLSDLPKSCRRQIRPSAGLKSSAKRYSQAAAGFSGVKGPKVLSLSKGAARREGGFGQAGRSRPPASFTAMRERQRIHKLPVGGREVGEAPFGCTQGRLRSDEVRIKSGWSQGALAGTERTQKVARDD